MIDLLKLRMGYLAEKQKLIASNIANLNTPGAKTKDLEPFSFDKTRKRLALKKTDKSHMAKKVKTEFVAYKPKGLDTSLDGNNISLERETTKLRNNDLEHHQAVSVYNKILSMYGLASQIDRKG